MKKIRVFAVWEQNMQDYIEYMVCKVTCMLLTLFVFATSKCHCLSWLENCAGP